MLILWHKYLRSYYSVKNKIILRILNKESLKQNLKLQYHNLRISNIDKSLATECMEYLKKNDLENDNIKYIKYTCKINKTLMKMGYDLSSLSDNEKTNIYFEELLKE